MFGDTVREGRIPGEEPGLPAERAVGIREERSQRLLSARGRDLTRDRELPQGDRRSADAYGGEHERP
jgi:hypothetical protein